MTDGLARSDPERSPGHCARGGSASYKSAQLCDSRGCAPLCRSANCVDLRAACVILRTRAHLTGAFPGWFVEHAATVSYTHLIPAT